MEFDPSVSMSQFQEAAATLEKELGNAPSTAVVLGSGLGSVFEGAAHTGTVHFDQVPHFPSVTVAGQRGVLSSVDVGGVAVCVVEGRLHRYEGRSLAEVVFPVRALALWGVKRFVLTNAAGAIKADFQPGDLMVARDHLNLLGENPLIGPNLDQLGPRFPDMSRPYCRTLIDLAYRSAAELNIRICEGVYAAVPGPSYETPAEVRMLRALGADAVGMSTVPEVIALNHMRRPVLAVSCITNMAAGMISAQLDHRDVIAVGKRGSEKMQQLIEKIVEFIEH